MLRFLSISLLTALLLFSGCKPTQVTTKKETQSPTVKSPVPSKDVETEKPIEKITESKEIKIALLLPLYLEQNFEIDTSDTEVDFEPRSLPALAFYEGAMLAVDSLQNSGKKIKIDVFDVASDSSAKHSIIINYAALKNYDLVFANYPSAQAVAAAEEAKLFGIKMVLTQFGAATSLKNNANLTLALPSTITQCRLMADYMLEQYHYSNFIVLSRNIKRENELADTFKTETDSLLNQKFNSGNKCLLLTYTDSVNHLLIKNLSAEKRNIIYLPSSEESNVSSILNGLDTLNEKITVVGLPTWENFETVQFGRLLNLEVYIFSTTYLDYENTEVNYFRKKYIDRYRTDALFSAYQGFMLTNYFSQLHSQFNSNFFDHLADQTVNGFKFIRLEKGYGFENNTISVLKYGGFRLMKVN